MPPQDDRTRRLGQTSRRLRVPNEKLDRPENIKKVLNNIERGVNNIPVFGQEDIVFPSTPDSPQQGHGHASLKMGFNLFWVDNADGVTGSGTILSDVMSIEDIGLFNAFEGTSGISPAEFDSWTDHSLWHIYISASAYTGNAIGIGSFLEYGSTNVRLLHEWPGGGKAVYQDSGDRYKANWHGWCVDLHMDGTLQVEFSASIYGLNVGADLNATYPVLWVAQSSNFLYNYDMVLVTQSALYVPSD